MLTEYFYPFDRGGSEWSTYYAARSLIKRGNTVGIFTPNYGTKNYEKYEGIEIYRFWFPIKLKKNSPGISPFWHTNIMWNVVTTVSLCKFLFFHSVDVIHIQGKYFLPAAILNIIIFRKKIIITLRDYQILCPHGLCLQKKLKACSLGGFIRDEIPLYMKNYGQGLNLPKKIFFYISGVRSKIISMILFYLCTKADYRIAISDRMKLILAKNNLKSVRIYNSMEIHPYKGKREKTLLFIGRLTPGKGADILIDGLAPFLIKHKEYSFQIIGQGFLKSQLKDGVRNYRLEKQVSFIDRLDYKDILKKIRLASVVIMPSRWEEPFGRVALEALSMGTPVIVSDKGGLPEIVTKGLGIVIAPQPLLLAKAINRIIPSHPKYVQRIFESKETLRHKFYEEPINQYLYLYEKLIWN